MFIKVYRLEIESFMLVFSTQLCELLPFSLSLWFNPLPLPSVNNYSVYCSEYTILHIRFMQGVRGRFEFCRKVHLQLNFFRWRHFALPSLSLFLRFMGSLKAKVHRKTDMEDGAFSPEGKASSAPSRSSSVSLLCGTTEEREGVWGRL